MNSKKMAKKTKGKSTLYLPVVWSIYTLPTTCGFKLDTLPT